MLERAHTAAHELRAELDTVRAELARARERFHEASTMGWHDNGRGGLYRVTELVTVAGQSDEDRAEHLAHLRGER